MARHQFCDFMLHSTIASIGTQPRNAVLITLSVACGLLSPTLSRNGGVGHLEHTIIIQIIVQYLYYLAYYHPHCLVMQCWSPWAYHAVYYHPHSRNGGVGHLERTMQPIITHTLVMQCWSPWAYHLAYYHPHYLVMQCWSPWAYHVAYYHPCYLM